MVPAIALATGETVSLLDMHVGQLLDMELYTQVTTASQKLVN